MSPFTPATIPAAGSASVFPVPSVTLPATPVDRDLALLVDSTTAPTWAWLLLYDASIAGASKWVFIGGAPAVAVVDTDESTASATYVDLTTVGPTFTIPTAGSYFMQMGSETYNTGAGADSFMALKYGAAATSDADGVGCRAPGLNQAENCFRQFAAVAATSGEVVKAQFRTNGGTAHWRKRSLYIWPSLLT